MISVVNGVRCCEELLQNIHCFIVFYISLSLILIYVHFYVIDIMEQKAKFWSKKRLLAIHTLPSHGLKHLLDHTVVGAIFVLRNIRV